MSGPLLVAVVGAGRAGRARVRALEGHPEAGLVAVARRSEPPRFGDVLADPEVDAVILCTPNLLHPEQAAAALDAGKHVAVEFPLAPDPETARELFARARTARRVLHVEHIELLSATQEAQRARVAELGRPRGGALEFQGGSDGWIGDAALAGTPGLRALARLHRLVDLFGPARVRSAELEASEAGYRLDVALAFERGGETHLVEARGRELARRTRWVIECERGLLDDPPPRPGGESLFRRDLDAFVAAILRGTPSYAPEERILEGLELVVAIDRATRP